MEHLIRLELKKFGVGRNIMFTVAAILFSILFITVSLVDSMTDPEQTKDTFESTFLIIGLLVSSIFLVYSSVLTARFVIGEYDRRTIILLFSYPLNRKGLIAGKMMIIMVYTAVSVMMGYICCTGFMINVSMSQSFSKQANNLWFQIYQVVRENCSGEYKGATPHDDMMERLLNARRGS